MWEQVQPTHEMTLRFLGTAHCVWRMQHSRQALWNVVAAVLANAAVEKFLAYKYLEEAEHRPNAAKASLEADELEA